MNLKMNNEPKNKLYVLYRGQEYKPESDWHYDAF